MVKTNKLVKKLVCEHIFFFTRMMIRFLIGEKNRIFTCTRRTTLAAEDNNLRTVISE